MINLENRLMCQEILSLWDRCGMMPKGLTLVSNDQEENAIPNILDIV
jgi:hypothetical protein